MTEPSGLTRRDFLKLLATLSAGAVLSRFGPYGDRLTFGVSPKPNIIIILFDAMSARHLSLYGYDRETTPNLTRFAERAAVYHSHYSAGSFTSSGTASLLTGMVPWTHRAINLGGLVKRSLVDSNIFQWIGSDYKRVAFAQNVWADLFLSQFGAAVDRHIPTNSFSFKSKTPIYSVNMPNDSVMTHYAFDEFLALDYKELTPLPGSFTLGFLSAVVDRMGRKSTGPSEAYPYGMPFNSLSYYYQNQVVFEGIRDVISKSVGSVPIFAYFHLFSPHAPYAPTRDFTGIFSDINIPYKPVHPLSIMHHKQKELNKFRLHYDECIANVDAEFGALMDSLAEAGILDNSYVVVTSDHGEVFERGEVGHGTTLIYNPVIHIPLLISAPGQAQRMDFYTPTNSIDVAPTLLKIAGRDVPPEIEGMLLPGFGGEADPHRSIYSIEAKESSAFLPLKTSTLSLIKDGYHLIYYKGYAKYPEVFELYDLEKDVEEKRDLMPASLAIAANLKDELLDSLSDADRPYYR
jgi:arylsulfatase A-like enzyme